MTTHLRFAFCLALLLTAPRPVAWAQPSQTPDFVVQIEAKDPSGTRVPATLTITSDATGLSQKGSLKTGPYTVALRAGATYEIEANHENYRTARKRLVLGTVRDPAAARESVELLMQPRQSSQEVATTVTVRIVDALSGGPLGEGFTIRVEDITRGQPLPLATADRQGVTFRTRPLHQFRFVVRAKGYEPYRYESEARMQNDILIPLRRAVAPPPSVAAARPADLSEVTVTARPTPARPAETAASPARPLQPVASPAAPTTTLDKVYFEQSSYLLRPESSPQLDQLTSQMRNRPTMQIEIAGHTDNVGDPRLNRALSENRARVIANYLIGKGIAADRIRSRGYGSTQPVAPNDTEENKRRNRRVEVRVIAE